MTILVRVLFLRVLLSSVYYTCFFVQSQIAQLVDEVHHLQNVTNKIRDSSKREVYLV